MHLVTYHIAHFPIEIAAKQEIRARPSKIVAGVEADKTNEFLQLLAKAADRRIDTTEAVALVNSGGHVKPEKKETKAAKVPVKGDSHKPTKSVKDPTKTSKNVKDASGGKTRGVKADSKPGAAKVTRKMDAHAKISKQDSKDSRTSDDSKRSKTKSSPRVHVEASSVAVSDAKSTVAPNNPPTDDAPIMPVQDEKAVSGQFSFFVGFSNRFVD